MKKLFLWIVLLLSFTVTNAQSDLITVLTSDNQLQAGVNNQGWVNTDGWNPNPTNANYAVGGWNAYRNYFFFDLSSITEPVIGATLQLQRYVSDFGFQYELYDVSSAAVDLIETRTQDFIEADPNVWEDLGSGTMYGSFFIDSGSTSDILSFVMNADAIIDINQAISEGSTYFAVGGRVPDAETPEAMLAVPPDPQPAYLFSYSSGLSAQRLIFETSNDFNTNEPAPVPEPATMLLLSSGLIGLIGFRKKFEK
jgi:hypothetical protein